MTEHQPAPHICWALCPECEKVGQIKGLRQAARIARRQAHLEKVAMGDAVVRAATREVARHWLDALRHITSKIERKARLLAKE